MLKPGYLDFRLPLNCSKEAAAASSTSSLLLGSSNSGVTPDFPLYLTSLKLILNLGGSKDGVKTDLLRSKSGGGAGI